MLLSLFPPDLSNLGLCVICTVCVWVLGYLCVLMWVLDQPKPMTERVSSLKALKNTNVKPQMFSQMHNNADHKYWEEETPQNSLHSWSLFPSLEKSCCHSGFSATKANLRVTWSIKITIKHFTACQCCLTLSSVSCQPLNAHRKKQKLRGKWAL